MIQAPKLFACALLAAAAGLLPSRGQAQSADWQNVIWREPQVRYLLADITLGGNVKLYRDYATTERDPDSREAIRLWDAGARVVNTNEFERKWVTNQFGKDGRVMRAVLRGSNRTITGSEVLLTSDRDFSADTMRLVLLHLNLGELPANYASRQGEPAVAEALRRWSSGCRAVNSNWFERRSVFVHGMPNSPQHFIYYRGTSHAADGSRVVLNSDVAYPETNARYFLADLMLGGSRDFYHRTAEAAHEMGCQEAVARFDAGVKITNLDQFERKQVDGKVLITRKGSNERISGMLVKLSTD